MLCFIPTRGFVLPCQTREREHKQVSSLPLTFFFTRICIAGAYPVWHPHLYPVPVHILQGRRTAVNEKTPWAKKRLVCAPGIWPSTCPDPFLDRTLSSTISTLKKKAELTFFFPELGSLGSVIVIVCCLHVQTIYVSYKTVVKLSGHVSCSASMHRTMALQYGFSHSIMRGAVHLSRAPRTNNSFRSDRQWIRCSVRE